MNTRCDVEKFLMKEMPGDWKKKHITELTMCLPCNEKFYKKPGVTECVINTYEEITRLFEVIHLDNIETICDPFSGTGTISKYIKNMKPDIHIITNDICESHGNNDFHENALSHEFYENFGCNFDVIITSPWFSILDLAIPTLIKYVNYFIAVHVPAYYLTNAHDHRMKYFRKLNRQGLIHIVGNLPHAIIGWKCIWILIFKNKYLARQYINSNLKFIKLYL